MSAYSIDTDDDGVVDTVAQEYDTNHDGVVDTVTYASDTDGDGLVNTYDNIVGYGGSGIFVYDHDADGTPDYRDLDTDGDGQPDVIEGNDFNLNGIADDNVTLTGLDTDGDGLDNRFDSLNSVTNIKGTSYRMGTGGTFTGDPSPGSKTTVQRKLGAQPNRDWRYVGVVLPVQFLRLNGLLQSNNVKLSWTVIASKEVDHFEVERSTDNRTYSKTGIVNGPVKVNEAQSFIFNEDISGLNADVVYYRIKVIGKAGEIQYSNVVVIRRQAGKTAMSLMPNPARDNVTISFFANSDGDVTIRMLDNVGKTIMVQTQKASKGTNTVQLPGLNKYSNGVYSLQVFVNGEVVTQKLVLAN